MKFQKTAKQSEAVRLMGDCAKYILLFGGSRCLTPGTLILTDKGYKPIIDVNISDKVFSLSQNNQIQLKQVVNKYVNTGEQYRHKVIIFVFNILTQVLTQPKHHIGLKW